MNEFDVVVNPLEQISYDFEKGTVQTCRDRDRDGPSILIG
jgi:hypothetical protein